MTLTRLRFSLDGDVQYSRAFDAMAHEAGDLSEPLGEIGNLLRDSIGQQFQTEGAHSGSPWQALNPAYARQKEERFPGMPILVATGDMRAAMLAPQSVTVTPRRLVYEPDDEKAIHHQRGAGRLPARRMVDLTLGDRRGFDRAIAGWLTGIRRGPLRSSRAG